MTKTFLHLFVTMFLTAVLIVNLMYFFNYTAMFPQLSGMDMSNKYFGFSNLIRSMQYSSDNLTWLNGLRTFLWTIENKAKQMLTSGWVDLALDGGVNDLKSFFHAIGLFFTSVAAIFVFLFYFLMTGTYYMLSVISFITLWIGALFSGSYSLTPSTYGTWYIILQT